MNKKFTFFSLLKEETHLKYLFFIALSGYSQTDGISLFIGSTRYPNITSIYLAWKILREIYYEMVYWGLRILDQYGAKKNITLNQELLKQVVSPEIFVNLNKYKETLRQEKETRYQRHVEVREKCRESVPTLESNLIK